MQNVNLHSSCKFGWFLVRSLTYFQNSFTHDYPKPGQTHEFPVQYFQFVPQWTEFPYSFTLTCKKNHHYKLKCSSLRYKQCNTHNSTSLLRRMSIKTSWLFPLYHFNHTMCLRGHILSGFSWLVSTRGKIRLFAVQNWLDHSFIHSFILHSMDPDRIT